MTRASRAYRLDRVLAAVVVVALVSLVLFAIVSRARARGDAVDRGERAASPEGDAVMRRPWTRAVAVRRSSPRRRSRPRAAVTTTTPRRHGAPRPRHSCSTGRRTPTTSASTPHSELGWYRDAGIDLTIVEPTEAGAEQAVGQGQAEFGVSIAEGVLPAREQGIPIVSIGAILPVNDSSLMALAERRHRASRPTSRARSTAVTTARSRPS